MKKLREVVAITGGCGRIGSALAEDLLKLGYKVLLGDINKRKLLMFKKKMKSKNIEIFFGDLTVKKNIDKFISFGLKKFEQIDSVVCCSYPKSKGWGDKFENVKEKFLTTKSNPLIGGIDIKIWSDCLSFSINFWSKLSFTN